MEKNIDWKSECDKLQEKYKYIDSKLLKERKRKKQIAELEKALSKYKKKLAAYKRRLGNALNTLDRKKEQVVKLRAELAALPGEAHQDH